VVDFCRAARLSRVHHGDDKLCPAPGAGAFRGLLYSCADVADLRRAYSAGDLNRNLALNIDDPERHVARFGGLAVLFVMATEHEYGPHLKQRIDPLITGVGPVEAAASAGATLAALAHRNALPDLVFTLGSAGSRTLEHAEIYQVKSVAYRDMDCTVLGFERGRTPFL